MFLFHKKPSLHLLLSQTTHHSLLPSILHRLSTLKPQNPPPKPCFMAEYLINSLGLPSDKAIKATKHLTHCKSPSKPDAVLHFLRECGLTDAQLRTLVSRQPAVLVSDVDKTLRPRFRLLQEMGFSQSDLVQLVSLQPEALRTRDLKPKIELLRSLFATDEDLMKAIYRNVFLLSCSYAKKMVPNVSLLRECGIPGRLISRMIVSQPKFISSRPETVEAKIRMAKELWDSDGSARSALPWQLLRSMLSLNKAKLSAKFKLLKELGWSEADIDTLCASHPAVLLLTEKNIRDKMSFFTKEVGVEPSFVAHNPILLTFSLEARLVPRHSVVRLLKNQGLFRDLKLTSTSGLTEKKFVHKFVLPYEKKIPGLREAYDASSAGLSKKTK